MTTASPTWANAVTPVPDCVTTGRIARPSHFAYATVVPNISQQAEEPKNAIDNKSATVTAMARLTACGHPVDERGAFRVIGEWHRGRWAASGMDFLICHDCWQPGGGPSPTRATFAPQVGRRFRTGAADQTATARPAWFRRPGAGWPE